MLTFKEMQVCMAQHHDEFSDLVPGDTEEEREINKKLAFTPGPWDDAVNGMQR